MSLTKNILWFSAIAVVGVVSVPFAAFSAPDPGPAPPGEAIAEFNAVTGEIIVSTNGIQNWIIEQIELDPVFTGADVQNLPAGGASNLVTDNDLRVGEATLSMNVMDLMTYTDVKIGTVIGSEFRLGGPSELMMGELIVKYQDGFGVPFSENLVAFVASFPPCDFDNDGQCNLADIDALIMEISVGGSNSIFDLNGDGFVNLGDRDVWLAQAGALNLPSGGAYLVGDANLDAGVDVSDFNFWNGSKFLATGLWSAADFNADGVTDVSDFNLWNGNKFTSADASAVPEPCSALLLVAAWMAAHAWWRKLR